MNELAADTAKEVSILSGAFNFFSPRFFSFTVPIEKERFIDPFLGLLNSSGKNAGVF